jgi:hypothetical protein
MLISFLFMNTLFKKVRSKMISARRPKTKQRKQQQRTKKPSWMDGMNE